MNISELWRVYNGVCLDAVFETEQEARDYALEMQKRHDLSGSLACFRVVRPNRDCSGD